MLFPQDGKYVFEWHDTKTHNSKRTIPLTTRAMEALKKQRVRGQEILLKNAQTAQDEYKNLVFEPETIDLHSSSSYRNVWM